MRNNAEKMNTAGKGRNRKLIAVVCVVVALILILVGILAVKDTILYSSALKSAKQGDFVSCSSGLHSVSSGKAAVLREYSDLRLDISRRYPSLLADFDIETVNGWLQTSQKIVSAKEDFPEEIMSEVSLLNEKLSNIVSLYERYNSKRESVLEMMDIFGEINRLYTGDGSGHNIQFTVAEEREKISRWEEVNNDLTSFSYDIPDGEKIYLFSYLIKSVQGELTDLREAMDNITAKGFGENDTVRVSGTGKKIFPSISNSDGVSVTVSSKESYEEYMAKSIYKALAGTLAEYYIGV